MDNYIELRVNASLGKVALCLLPLLVIIFFALLRYGDRRLYLFLTYEDHFLEWVSALFYFLAAVTALKLTLLRYSQSIKLDTIMYGCFAIGMFFIFGEEISWGQRIFGITSPDYFLANNAQSETNLHNLKPVQSILHLTYILIGVLGAILWIVPKLTNNEHWLFNDRFLPNWYLMFYFLPVSLFYFGYDYMGLAETPQGLIGRDQEVCELLLSLGFLLFIFINWLKFSSLKIARQPAKISEWVQVRYQEELSGTENTTRPTRSNKPLKSKSYG